MSRSLGQGQDHKSKKRPNGQRDWGIKAPHTGPALTLTLTLTLILLTLTVSPV